MMTSGFKGVGELTGVEMADAMVEYHASGNPLILGGVTSPADPCIFGLITCKTKEFTRQPNSPPQSVPIG